MNKLCSKIQLGIQPKFGNKVEMFLLKYNVILLLLSMVRHSRHMEYMGITNIPCSHMQAESSQTVEVTAKILAGSLVSFIGGDNLCLCLR